MDTDDPIEENWQILTVFIVALSVLPGLVTLASLWIDASQHVGPMKAQADKLEDKALRLKP